ncbi:MAG TPA: lysyl oxidase family protein [Solirubrobacteraceae bacterium]|nr:lysyl oxidase family protein [Solirubrobacteraceae bacterium]
MSSVTQHIYGLDGRRYPACSQDPARRSVTLGTSVGWADEYPADYHEQWIDVTGLQGRFVFVQRVDPRNAIRESDETNNVSPRITRRLPPPGPRKPARGRPGY